jgi:hypothetical protein
MPLGHLIALISNAHRVRSYRALPRREAALAGELRLGAHCTERPEVIRINPIQFLACARNRRSSTSKLAPRCSWKTPTSTPALRNIPSLRCQLCRLRSKRSGGRRQARGPERNSILIRMDGAASWRAKRRWWSQTGSNRRPQACKASALPTELWPHGPPHCRAAIGNQSLAHREAQLRDVVGLGRFELPTSRLSSARSNQLSYRPEAQASMRRKRNEDGGVPL